MKDFQVFEIQDGKIAKYRTQHQCITFATDTEPNNVGTFQVIPKDQKTLRPWFLLLIKFPNIQVHLGYFHIYYRYDGEKIHTFQFYNSKYFKNWLLLHLHNDVL